jgi:hypothetical protein
MNDWIFILLRLPRGRIELMIWQFEDSALTVQKFGLKSPNFGREALTNLLFKLLWPLFPVK